MTAQEVMKVFNEARDKYIAACHERDKKKIELDRDLEKQRVEFLELVIKLKKEIE